MSSVKSSGNIQKKEVGPERLHIICFYLNDRYVLLR